MSDGERAELYNELKFRSRHTAHEELVKMKNAQDSMDFSGMQISGLVRRNTLMELQMDKPENSAKQSSSAYSSIAQDQGRKYILVKNEDPNTGLGFILKSHSEAMSHNKPKEAEVLHPPR